VPGQVRGRPPPKNSVPAASKLPDVEITQARNLDVECLPVRCCRTDPYARHGFLRATGAWSGETWAFRRLRSQFGRLGWPPPCSN
jgi:hypothetical protein